MIIKVELFGICREFSEQDYLNFDFHNEITVKELKNKMIEIVKQKFRDNKNYHEMVDKSSFSLNDEVISENFILNKNQTISIIPPIGGG
mgnify:CR=1 FL=1